MIGTDRVSLNDPASGVYETAAVGTGIPVSVSLLVLLGPDAGNYILADPSLTADIGIILPVPSVKPAPVALPSPIPLLPMLSPLPQPTPTGGAGALMVLGANGIGPLPSVIAEEDAAGLLFGPGEITLSTGLPLAAGAEQVLILTGRTAISAPLPPASSPVSRKGGL